MNTQQRAVVQQALEALEDVDGIDTETECVTIDVGEAITALRQLLEQPEREHDHALEQALTRLQKRYSELEAKVGSQPEQADETVAWMYPDDYERMMATETFCTVYSVKVLSPTQGASTVPLYTRPCKECKCNKQN